MGDLSVKGIMRRHVGVTGSFSLNPILLPLALLFDPDDLPSYSLRPVLEGVARTEREYERHDHPYEWVACYEQTWTHIRVRIELDPKDGGAENALNSGLQSTWKNGIEGAWNRRFSARHNGELACRLSFEVVFTDNDPHQKVEVRSVNIPPTVMTNWNTPDNGAVVAHEYGHMIGKFDEYSDPLVPGREHVETGTIMETTSSIFDPRQFTRFIKDIGCFLCFDNSGVSVPKPYRRP
jgi:hypothetical protein